jgi:hypothetical protein
MGDTVRSGGNMKKDTEKKAEQTPPRLVLKRETLRKLRPTDLTTAVGAGDPGTPIGIKPT